MIDDITRNSNINYNNNSKNNHDNNDENTNDFFARASNQI